MALDKPGMILYLSIKTQGSEQLGTWSMWLSPSDA